MEINMLSLSTVNLTLIDLLVICSGFFIVLYFYGRISYTHFQNKGVKSLKPLMPFFGSTIWVHLGVEHLKDFVLKCYNTCKYDKYCGFYEMQRPLILVKDVEIVKLIGITDFDSFCNRSNFISEEIDPLLGNALISLKNEKWQNMRTALIPAFKSSQIQNLFALVEEVAKEFSNYLIEQSKNPVKDTIEIEANDFFIKYTNDVIASCAFGLNMNSMKNSNQKFCKLENISGWLQIKLILLIYFPRLTKFFKIKFFPEKVVSFFRNLIQRTIKDREIINRVRHDLLNTIVETKIESMKHEKNMSESDDIESTKVKESTIENEVISKNWNDEELIAQTMTLFLGGFETISTLITFFFYEMARNPIIQKKVQEEIDKCINDLDHEITYTDLMQLKYLDMTISETLRMWPPILVTDRVCTKDYTLPPANVDNIQNYQVQKDDTIWIPIYALHHDPKHFPEPNHFDPDRFSDEFKSNIHPMTYLPFGIGPRKCLGYRFALLVAKLIIFQTLLKFDIEVTKNTQIPIILNKSSTSLIGNKGMYIGLKLRKS